MTLQTLTFAIMTLDPHFIDTNGPIFHPLVVSKQQSPNVCSPNIAIFSAQYCLQYCPFVIRSILLTRKGQKCIWYQLLCPSQNTTTQHRGKARCRLAWAWAPYLAEKIYTRNVLIFLLKFIQEVRNLVIKPYSWHNPGSASAQYYIRHRIIIRI